MNGSTGTIADPHDTSPVFALFDEVRAARRRRAIEAAASWLLATGWRLEIDHFEDELVSFSADLTDDDLGDLRACRERLVSARAA
jgi:hypothetical protein